jgi:hypothetical protein
VLFFHGTAAFLENEVRIERRSLVYILLWESAHTFLMTKSRAEELCRNIPIVLS